MQAVCKTNMKWKERPAGRGQHALDDVSRVRRREAQTVKADANDPRKHDIVYSVWIARAAAIPVPGLSPAVRNGRAMRET